MPSDCNGVPCFQQIFEKESTSEIWDFNFSVSSSTFLTASWLLILCLLSLVELYCNYPNLVCTWFQIIPGSNY